MKTMFRCLIIILAIGIIIPINSGCKKDEEKPGPISVQNIISPTAVINGGSILWTIKVNNSGGKVTVDRIHVKEECISGWAQGMGTAELDIPISEITIDAHAVKNVYSNNIPLTNTGYDDVEMRNTVTVYSNGGTETDICIYKIIADKKRMGNIKIQTILTGKQEKID